MVSEDDLRGYIVVMIESAKNKNITLFNDLNDVFEKKLREFLTEQGLSVNSTNKWDNARNLIAGYFSYLINRKVEKPELLVKALALVS